MTSRIELRKEQQRTILPGSGSLGWTAGECVADPLLIWNPGDIQTSTRGWLQVDNGFDVRGISEKESNIFISVDLSAKISTELGVIIEPKATTTKFWKTIPLDGTALTVKPTFSEFRSSVKIDEIYVDVIPEKREDVVTTITLTGAETYTVRYNEVLPTWDTARTLDEALWEFGGEARARTDDFFYVGRTVFRGTDRASVNRTRDSLLGLSNSATFSTIPNISSLNLDPQSSKSKEAYPGGSLWIYWGHFSTTNGYNQGLIKFAGYSGTTSPNDVIPTDGLFYPQLTGYQSERTETRTRTTLTPGTTTSKPPNVILSAKFEDSSGTTLQIKTATIKEDSADEDGIETLSLSYTGNGAPAQVTLDVEEYPSWLRSIKVPLPRVFNDKAKDSYKINTQEILELDVFGHAAPINVPSNATLTGTRPNEYLTYSGTWDGNFQSLRCRCPAWILYDVLTNERFGIELAASRINANSFFAASQYCQALIDSKPRWAFDGILKGTQKEIIRTLLSLVRGWLVDGADGKLALKLERPSVADWLICPAVTVDGNITYRDSLPKSPVRCGYTNRLTGIQETTTGLDDARQIEVAWQDPEVAERWAQHESYAEQHLLDSVEFTLPWSYHRIAPGDLINLYDPIRAGIRTAGRVTGNTATYLTLDGPPLGLWPDLVAGAGLLQTGRNAAIDQDTWGWSTFTFPTADRPTIRVQRASGGFDQYTITRIDWLAGGRPGHNRVHLAEDLGSADLSRQVWAVESSAVYPTQWRVQSVSESGREFGIVCTPYINGMHQHIEEGTAMPAEPKRYSPATGTKLSTFQGPFDELTMRYPDDTAGPFDPENTMDGLTTSAL